MSHRTAGRNHGGRNYRLNWTGEHGCWRFGEWYISYCHAPNDKPWTVFHGYTLMLTANLRPRRFATADNAKRWVKKRVDDLREKKR